MEEKENTTSHLERQESPADDSEKAAQHKANQIEDAKLSTFISNNVDYSGATSKTDPAEIKLVRKLDTWIMPMYVLTSHWLVAPFD